MPELTVDSFMSSRKKQEDLSVDSFMQERASAPVPPSLKPGEDAVFPGITIKDGLPGVPRPQLPAELQPQRSDGVGLVQRAREEMGVPPSDYVRSTPTPPEVDVALEQFRSRTPAQTATQGPSNRRGSLGGDRRPPSLVQREQQQEAQRAPGVPAPKPSVVDEVVTGVQRGFFGTLFDQPAQLVESVPKFLGQASSQTEALSRKFGITVPEAQELERQARERLFDAAFGEPPKTGAGQFAEAFGSGVAFAPVAVMGGGATAALGGALGAGEAVERAQTAPIEYSPGEKAAIIGGGILLGLTDAIPWGHWAARLKSATGIGKKVTEEELRAVLQPALKEYAQRTAQQFVEEGSQEALQNIGQDMLQVATGSKQPNEVGETVADEFLAGGGVGATMEILSVLVGSRVGRARLREAGIEPEQVEELIQETKAEEKQRSAKPEPSTRVRRKRSQAPTTESEVAPPVSAAVPSEGVAETAAPTTPQKDLTPDTFMGERTPPAPSKEVIQQPEVVAEQAGAQPKAKVAEEEGQRIAAQKLQEEKNLTPEEATAIVRDNVARGAVYQEDGVMLQKPDTAAPDEKKEPETLTGRSYHSTQVDLPKKIADRVREFSPRIVPESALAEDGRENEPHITVLYGLKDEATADKVRELLADEGPIKARIKTTSVFPAEDSSSQRGGARQSDVVKLDVESADLDRINKKLRELPNANEFPDYKPHVTLAYVKPGEGQKYAGRGVPGVTGQTITFDSLSFKGKDGETVTIPLGAKRETLPEQAVSMTPEQLTEAAKTGDQAAQEEINKRTLEVVKEQPPKEAPAPITAKPAEAITSQQAFKMKGPELKALAEKGDVEAQKEIDRREAKRGGPYEKKQADFLKKVERVEGAPTPKVEVSQEEVAARKAEVDERNRQAQSKAAAAQLRKGAEGLTNQIEAKLNPGVANQNPTARRNRMADSSRAEGHRLERIQKGLNKLADMHESGEIPPVLAKVRTRATFEELMPRRGADGEKYKRQFPRPHINRVYVNELLEKTKGTKGTAEGRAILERKSGAEVAYFSADQVEAIEAVIKKAEERGFKAPWVRESFKTFKRLDAAGITPENFQEAEDAIEALGVKKREPTKEERVAQMERDLAVGSKIEGYFPTPKPLAKRMVEQADIEPGMKVLEPSAGNGNIADALKESGADVKVIEQQSSLRDILELKGYGIVGRDFMEFNEGGWDRIVMNPPFERGQDMEHVQHAYELLAPGGKVVAIMSEGSFGRSDKKATAFREWLDENSGESEKLPEGSFTGKDAMRQTGVATRLVELTKPEAVEPAQKAESKPEIRPEEATPTPSPVVESKPYEPKTAADLQTITFDQMPDTDETEGVAKNRGVFYRSAYFEVDDGGVEKRFKVKVGTNGSRTVEELGKTENQRQREAQARYDALKPETRKFLDDIGSRLKIANRATIGEVIEGAKEPPAFNVVMSNIRNEIASWFPGVTTVDGAIKSMRRAIEQSVETDEMGSTPSPVVEERKSQAEQHGLTQEQFERLSHAKDDAFPGMAERYELEVAGPSKSGAFLTKDKSGTARLWGALRPDAKFGRVMTPSVWSDLNVEQMGGVSTTPASATERKSSVPQAPTESADKTTFIEDVPSANPNVKTYQINRWPSGKYQVRHFNASTNSFFGSNFDTLEQAREQIEKWNTNYEEGRKVRAEIEAKTLRFEKRGDFYELYGDQARDVAKALDLTLTTSRDGRPVVGIPYHSFDRNSKELEERGFNIAPVPRPSTKTGIAKAASAKADKFLDKQVRTSDYGVVTYRELVQNRLRDGGRVEAVEVEDEAERKKLQQQFDRMNQGFNIPWGNENHPKTIEAQALKDKLAGKITSTEYRLHRPDGDGWSVINKTTYDYAKDFEKSLPSAAAEPKQAVSVEKTEQPQEDKTQNTEPSAERFRELYKEIQDAQKDPLYTGQTAEASSFRDRVLDMESELEFHRPAAVAEAQREIDQKNGVVAPSPVPKDVEERFASEFKQKVSQAKKQAYLDFDEAEVRSTIDKLMQPPGDGNAATVGKRDAIIHRKVETVGRGKSKETIARYTAIVSAPRSASETQSFNTLEDSAFWATDMLYGLGRSNNDFSRWGGGGSHSKTLKNTGSLLSLSQRAMAASDAAAMAINRPEIAGDVYHNAMSGGWGKADTFADVARLYADSLPRNESPLVNRGSSKRAYYYGQDIDASLVQDEPPKKGSGTWDFQLEGYQNTAKGMLDRLQSVRARIATAKLLNGGTTERIAESERFFDKAEANIKKNLEYVQQQAKDETSTELKELRKSMLGMAEGYAKYGDVAFSESSAQKVERDRSRYSALAGLKTSEWPEVMASLGVESKAKPELIEIPTGKDKLVKSELESIGDVDLVDGRFTVFHRDAVSRFKGRGWLDDEGGITPLGTRAFYTLKQDADKQANGKVMAEYRPSSARVPAMEGRFGATTKVDGEDWHTNGHGAWKGAQPSYWPAPEKDSSGPDLKRVIPSQKGDQVKPVGFYTAQQRGGPKTFIVFNNGTHMDSVMYDYTVKREGAVEWTQVREKKKEASAFQAWKDGKLVALVMPIRDSGVPKNLKSLIDADESEPVREAREAPGFYSQLQRTIQNKFPAKTSNAQAIAILRNPQNGVKPDELKWTGVEQWLLDKKGAVTKDELLEFVKSNEVRVEEVTKGKLKTPPQLQWATEVPSWMSEENTDSREHVAYGHRGSRYVISGNEDAGFVANVYEGGEEKHIGQFGTVEEAKLEVQQVEDEEMLDASGEHPGDTKYGQYTLPGGQNYRELLLTLPVDENKAHAGRSERAKELIARRDKLKLLDDELLLHSLNGTMPDGWRVDPPIGTSPGWGSLGTEWRAMRGDSFLAEGKTEQEALADAIRRERVYLGREIRNTETYIDMVMKSREPVGAYRSPHWDEPNVLAHVRFDDRTGPNGERILHVSEIQSDWHQQGRKKGYKGLSPEELARKERLDAQDGVWAEEDVDWYNEVVNDRQRDGVPAAPFEKSWHELAFKRVLRYATENGYDKLTWDTGETSADRYDLSKHIDALRYQPHADGTYTIMPMKGQATLNINVKTDHLTPSEIADVVGKDIADKIVAGEGVERDEYMEGMRKRGQPIEAFQQEETPKPKPITELPDDYNVMRDRNKDESSQYAVAPEWQSHGRAMAGWHATPELAKAAAIEMLNDRKLEEWRRENYGAGKWFLRYEHGATMGTWLSKEDAERDAQRQREMLAEPPQKELSGVDLKVGGEGMKGFYDKILPTFANKYLKKWGGKVERGSLETGEDRKTRVLDTILREDFGTTWADASETQREWARERQDKDRSSGKPVSVHSVTITPEMRESVMAGQPLFARDSNLEVGSAAPTAEYRRGVLWLNSAAFKEIRSAVGLETREGSSATGLHVPRGAALKMLGFPKTAISPEVRSAFVDAFRDKGPLGGAVTIVRRDPGESISRAKELARHELFHATERWAGDWRADDLLADPLGMKAAEALEDLGYESTPQILFSEIGAHLVSGPRGWAKLGLSTEEAIELFRTYVGMLDIEHIERIEKIAPQLNEELNVAKRFAKAVRAGMDAGSLFEVEETEEGAGGGDFRGGGPPDVRTPEGEPGGEEEPPRQALTREDVRASAQSAKEAGRIVLDQLILPARSVIARQGPAGRRLARLIERAFDVGEVEAGKRLEKLIDAKLGELNQNEQDNLLDALEGRADSVSGKVANAYITVRAILDEMGKAAEDMGVEVTYTRTIWPGEDTDGLNLTDMQRKMLESGRPVRIKGKRAFKPRRDYFPHIIPDVEVLQRGVTPHPIRNDIIRNMVRMGEFADEEAAADFIDKYVDFIKNGGRQQQLEQYLIESGQAATPEEALTMMRKFRNRTIKKVGQMEYARDVNFPVYDPNPARVIPGAITRASVRQAQIQMLGQYNQRVNRLVAKIEEAGGDVETTQKAIDAIMGMANQGNTKVAKLSRWLRAIQATKLGLLTTIANSAQGFMNSMFRADLPTAVKGTMAAFAPEGRRLSIRSGASLEATLSETLRDSGAKSTEFLERYLRVSGFTASEKMNRVIAANTGAVYAGKLLAVLKKNPKDTRARDMLKELGINPDEALQEGRLTGDDILMAAKKFSDMTQFRSRPQDLPLFASTPAGKVFFQFKTYIYGQTRMIYEETIGEIKAGRPGRALRSLLILATVFPMAGYVIKYLRDLIMGRDPNREKDELKRYLDSVAQVGAGAILLDAAQSLEYSNEGLLRWAAGPAASDILVDVPMTGKDIVTKGKLSDSRKRQWIRKMPFGSMIADWLYPPKKK